MRVAIDIQSTYGQKTGIGQYASRLAAGLKQVAPSLDLFPLSLGRDIAMRTDRRILWQQLHLPRLARRQSPDILHVPGFDAPRWKPCPVVLTVHDLIGMLFPQNLPPAARFYWAWWLPHSIRWADRVIADSENTRQDIVRLVGLDADRIEVIPLGVERSFQPVQDQASLDRVRRRYNLPDKFLLYLGTLEPRKGIDTIISAYHLLSGQNSQAMVIAGKKGWYEDTLFEQVRTLRLEGRVHFTGYPVDEDLPALYSLASAFLFPSRYEGFGLPPLEAMACGTPVICSNAASLPEVAGDAAVLIPPDRPELLAAAIERVLQDRAFGEELRARGLVQASRFTWEETAHRTLQVYEGLR
jgi:glycosyltransferase involved in cell wall biosynthesis